MSSNNHKDLDTAIHQGEIPLQRITIVRFALKMFLLPIIFAPKAPKA